VLVYLQEVESHFTARLLADTVALRRTPLEDVLDGDRPCT
jgi:hypothetical protein